MDLMDSFGEWNVWCRTRRTRAERVKPGWPVAPQILQEIYTMADALRSAAPASRC